MNRDKRNIFPVDYHEGRAQERVDRGDIYPFHTVSTPASPAPWDNGDLIFSPTSNRSTSLINLAGRQSANTTPYVNDQGNPPARGSSQRDLLTPLSRHQTYTNMQQPTINISEVYNNPPPPYLDPSSW